MCAELARGQVYSVVELAFSGPACGPADAPARDIDFRVRLRHEDGTAHTIHGFWDGDGAGGRSGNVFRIRFCPTHPGRWMLDEVVSSASPLRGQHEGSYVTAEPSSRPGFWLVDEQSPGRRWFKRSDGSHTYVFGNTHYSFVSQMKDDGPNGSDIARDVRQNARHFKKLRFSIHGDRYPHPTDKPFLDDAGLPTLDGDHSHRPDPAWFSQRVDLAVATAFEVDLIADIILAGPDRQPSRATLRAAANGGDASPYLRYIAARYGSYPNVWLCLCNEWDIRKPNYEPQYIARLGQLMHSLLAYPVPLSVHGNNVWHEQMNTDPPWNTHAIVQGKIKTLAESADYIVRNHQLVLQKPVVNDELAYQGEGDGFGRDDVIESHLGAFLGGGYASTGYKTQEKKTHYFWGAFRADEHTAAVHLGWLAERISADLAFWNMSPEPVQSSIFVGLGDRARLLSWPGRQYVLGGEPGSPLAADLPEGAWRVEAYDAIAMRKWSVSERAQGRLEVRMPQGRAGMLVFTRL